MVAHLHDGEADDGAADPGLLPAHQQVELGGGRGGGRHLLLQQVQARFHLLRHPAAGVGEEGTSFFVCKSGYCVFGKSKIWEINTTL